MARSGLLARVARRAAGESSREFSADFYYNGYIVPTSFGFNGTNYPAGYGGLQTTWASTSPDREIAVGLETYMAALRRCPPAFAAQLARSQVLSQVRFCFRNRPDTSTPRRTFSSARLRRLEVPWPQATTGQMVSLLEWYAGVAGNAYIHRQADRIRVLRPDWVVVIYGSRRQPDDPAWALDGEVIGYGYQNRGIGGGYPGEIELILPQDMIHWTPIPDPLSPGLGMSWLTPAVRDIQGDIGMTEHKLRFLANGATPNLVVKGLTADTQEAFDALVAELESKHAGLANAYRTLYLSGGADATVVGADLRQLDFKAVQGAGETRISMLSRVPATILQISEGLSGSSLNEGNFAMARRIWADTWIYPTIQDLARALTPLVNVPNDAELWPDTGDMPILREDAKDAAEIENIKAITITKLVIEGFTPKSAIAAVMGQNMSLLEHTGLVSVQLQPPGTEFPQQQGAPGQPQRLPNQAVPRLQLAGHPASNGRPPAKLPPGANS